MTSVAQETLIQILNEGGFIQGGKRSLGLINAQDAAKSMNTDLRYHRLLTSSTETESVDLVYEVPSQVNGMPGTPSIYFKVFNNQPSLDTIINLRTSIWNQGLVPTLWVITPDTVRIYDSFARPQRDETENSHLITKLTDISNRLKFLKEEFHKNRFDNGDFWQSVYGMKINRGQRVDISMLADLSQTMEILTSSHPNIPALSVPIAHALLGRSIFVSYLQDRLILDSSFFERNYDCHFFKELLNNKSSTYSFFTWLRDTFNGDLFPIQQNEEELVDKNHLLIIQQFLSGADMYSYPNWQPRFWPYKFNIIPIELISSIYEMFAHNLDPKAAEARSVHYTRLQLVELLLSVSMQDLTHNARVLDPACGSGVFLVETFRRLAWLRSKEYGRLLRRDELHEMLQKQIFGIDIDSDAVHVAAFSLYLTLLELDPDPQPPAALKFPSLVNTNTSIAQGPNLYIQDFCNTEHDFNRNVPFKDKAFDLIIGNPPWTALKEENAPRDPDDPINGRQWGLEYCRQLGIPDNKPDQAFMIRARDFAKATTTIAFIVGSRILYQQAGIKGNRWFDTFLDDNTIKTLINFSDLVDEDLLFGKNIKQNIKQRSSQRSSTRLPASAILFHIVKSEQDNNVIYISPKWYPSIKRRGEIVLTADDIRVFSQKLLRDEPLLWKVAFRGTSRDYDLLKRLQKLPSLENVLNQFGIKDQASIGITFGKGRQKSASKFEGIPFLPSASTRRYRIAIDDLHPFNHPTIAEKSNTHIFPLPAQIVFKSLQDGSACAALIEETIDQHQVVINQMYYGISFANTPPSLKYRVNAILNSKIAFYEMFMLSYRLGWDRKLIEVADWLKVRFPKSIFATDTDNTWEEVLSLESLLRSFWQRSNPNDTLDRELSDIQHRLDQAIYQMYELSKQEIILIEDTLHYNVNLFLHRKSQEAVDAFAPPTSDDLIRYAQRIRLQLNSILSFDNLELNAKVYKFKHRSPLSICQFTQQRSGEHEAVTIVEVSEVEEVFNQLSYELYSEIADNLFIQRNLRIYETEGFLIIKPAEKHLWSEATALNDSDIILREHMEEVVIG